MQWLLIEAFDSHSLSVIGVGHIPKTFLPLERFLRRPGRRDEVLRGIRAAETARDTIEITPTSRRRVIVKPLISYRGDVHGYQAWAGYLDEEPPDRDPAGAWYFNATTGQIGGSDDLLDLYGEPRELRRHERTTAEAFGRLIPNDDESDALAMLVSKAPGTTHHATWTVIRDDGQRRAGHLSCRVVREGDGNAVVRGITHDIGVATTSRAPAPRPVLAQRVLAGLAQPGQHRVLIDPVTLHFIRWLEGDAPLPGLAWTHSSGGDQPIHPDDLPQLRSAIERLATTNARLTLRLALDTSPRSWLAVPTDLNVVLLNARTNAVLLTLHDPRRSVVAGGGGL